MQRATANRLSLRSFLFARAFAFTR